eukprot:11476586-Ditylum_brightwellii.AAC.1
MAPLFGRGDVLTLTLDCDDHGGVLTFAVNGTPVDGLEIAGIFELLGDSEVFPAISMSPYDPVKENGETKESVGGSELRDDMDKEAPQQESKDCKEDKQDEKLEE